jgi:protocatechuate 3,4-dioxygenase beta subunit
MDEPDTTNAGRLRRRQSLAKAGGLAALFAGAAGWKLASGEDDADAAVGPAAVAAGTVTCVLAPEQTEGPYYVSGAKIRRTISDGRPGVPLTLRLRVVDASGCRPIRKAVVDVWHADALGSYSGISDQAGKTFMRGLQGTDANGLALFKTVYPGWYPGRTVHIHVMVHLGGNVVHTGQLYFPDAVTDAVYRRSPYRSRPNRQTRNTDDAIYRNGGRRSQLAVRRLDTGAYTAAITMGVHRS